MDAGVQWSGHSSDLELRLESAGDPARLHGRHADAGVVVRAARRRTTGAPTRVRDVSSLDSRVAVASNHPERMHEDSVTRLRQRR